MIQPSLFQKSRKPRGTKRSYGPTPLERARANPDTDWCDFVFCRRQVAKGHGAIEVETGRFGHMTCVLRATALPHLEEIDRLNALENLDLDFAG